MGLRNPIVGFCYPTLTLAWQHSAWNPFGFYAGSLLPLLLTCSSDHGFVFVFFLSCFQCTQGKSCSGCLLRWACPSSLHSAEVTVSWELFVLFKRHPQCHWSVLCLCRCWWGMPAACVTVGAMSVFAFLRNELHFKVILLIFTAAFQHSSVFHVGPEQNYWSLLFPPHQLFKVGRPGCGTCATCGSLSSHSL